VSRVVIWLLSLNLLFASDATIDVKKSADLIPSIAVEDGSINYRHKISKRFQKILTSDLAVLAQFNVRKTYQKNIFSSDNPHKENEDMNYVVRYRLKQSNQGIMICDYKIIDAKKQETLLEDHVKVMQNDLYVFAAHKIAYDLNKYFGFPDVKWMKQRVVFARYISPRNSDIVISDYSLTYQKLIIRGGLNIFPKWADAKQHAFYYTVVGEKPTLYRYNMTTGKHKKIISSSGMLVCSDVSKDYKQLLLTMAPDDQPDIYLYDVKSDDATRLTKYQGIDVGGQFLDDGKRFAFVSERLGYPNIFAKGIENNEVEQLVYYGKNNNSCSTYRNYIVYTSRETNNAFSQNSFNLHMVSTQTEYVRHLTSTGVNQFPKFSDDGDAIIFIKHYKRQSALGIIRLKQNKSYLFPLKVGKIQSLDW